MKKNFFKKLSFVLAFAMVATSVAPAASASAAAAPNLAKRYTTAYEGNTRAYAVKNAAGYTVKWVVSGKGAKYVTLSKKTGAKTVLSVDTDGAVAAKNAPVVVTAKFYKGKKLVKQAGDAVTVKVSATAVDIVTKADVTKFPTGEAVKLSRKITPANATSVTYWSVTDKDGKATTKATIDGKGNLTVTELGDYIVVAEAKNAKNGKVIAKDTQEINAVLGIEKATQQSVTKLDVFFNTDMKDAKAADFAIVNDDNKTTVAVKGVEVDGKKVTVETFADINDGKSYTVTYKDAKASFVATDNKVATIAITPATVPATVATEMKVLAKDANGVILSENPYRNVKDNKITFDITDIKTGYTDDKNLVLNKVGDTAKASATYHTWEYKDGKEVGTITAELTITAVDKTALTLKESKLHIGKNKPSSWSQSDLNDKLALEDSGKKVFVYLKDSNDKEPTTGYTLESSNKDVMLLDGNGFLTADVTAVKAGTAYVLVKDVDGKIILSLPVNIVAKRTANQLILGKYDLTVSNASGASDVQNVSVEVKDQYGDKMADKTKAGEIEVTCISAPSGVDKGTAKGYATAGVDKVSFDGSRFAAGSYSYNIKAGGFTQTVRVTAKTPSGTGISYELILSSTDVDLKVDSTSETKTVEAKVAVKQGDAIIGYLPIKGNPTRDINGDTDNVVIKKGNDAVTGSTIVDATTGSIIIFKALTVPGDGTANKDADTGSYSVEVTIDKYEITSANSKNVDTTTRYTKVTGSNAGTLSLKSYFNIKDTQATLTAVREKENVGSSTVEQGVLDAFKFYYEGNELTDLDTTKITVDATSNNDIANNSFNIKSVKVEVTADGIRVPVKVEINKSIKIRQ